MNDKVHELMDDLRNCDNHRETMLAMWRVLTVAEVVIALMCYLALALNRSQQDVYICAAVFWAVAAARCVSEYRADYWTGRWEEAAEEYARLRGLDVPGEDKLPFDDEEDDGK